MKRDRTRPGAYLLSYRSHKHRITSQPLRSEVARCFCDTKMEWLYCVHTITRYLSLPFSRRPTAQIQLRKEPGYFRYMNRVSFPGFLEQYCIARLHSD